MLGWIVLGASVIIMFRVAEMEERSGFLWAGLTFATCYACAIFIDLPIIKIIIGLVIVFGAMFVLKLIDK